MWPVAAPVGLRLGSFCNWQQRSIQRLAHPGEETIVFGWFYQRTAISLSREKGSNKLGCGDLRSRSLYVGIEFPIKNLRTDYASIVSAVRSAVGVEYIGVLTQVIVMLVRSG
jgi:hypothetical protein